ncbi:antirestriction protein [Arcicella aurantiaca]|uniref:Antirestriction protein n=1 Tax=Arcicella aurantiaca TaxID=591202 RepID=A0A316DEW1_9BACT|nr:antirestriction protein ArdA [Arcicella aurantiaca]PWK16118.1 antirestriction protein [Arcicella aurantiaca]
MEKPRVYVGTYDKYSMGSIKGDWLELSNFENKEAFLKACKKLHKDESSPEFMYQDFENFPRVLYSESNITKVFDYLKAIESMDNDMIEAFNYFVSDVYYGWSNADSMKKSFESSFQGKYPPSSLFLDTELEFTHQYVESHEILKGMDENLHGYFDFHRYSQMLFTAYYTSVNEYVFTLNY